MALDINKLKLTWKGPWRERTWYDKNDIVQWQGKSYRCIRDNPKEYSILSEGTAGTSHSGVFEHPEVAKWSCRPDNKTYWVIHIRGNVDVSTWDFHRQYEVGEMCKANGHLYQCIKGTRYKNTWVEETDYWVKVLESSRGRDGRHEGIAFRNHAPLGWKYNMGYKMLQSQQMTGNSGMHICSDGTVQCVGGQDQNGYNGIGASGVGSNYNRGKHHYPGFTFTDWLMSGDNKSWNTLAKDVGEGLITPDGETPRVVQCIGSAHNSFFLMNNGEVYATGYNGNAQFGDRSTSDRYYPVRCAADDYIDWLGNPISKSFSDTKIIKIESTSAGGNTSSTSSTMALGEDGSVWLWGYNNQGHLGFGNPDVKNSGDFNGSGTATGPDGQTYTYPNTWAWYSSNFSRPMRLPQTYFNGKMIVDIYASGSNEGRFWALDEEGLLWAWGHNNNGELGVGHRDGTYYMHTPTPVSVDFNYYGGLKKLDFVPNNSSGSTGILFALDGEGWLWACGYQNAGQMPGFARIGGHDSHQFGAFKRLNFRPNGDIEDFWPGGETGAEFQIAIRQKSTGQTWQSSGNYTNGALGHSVSGADYWYQSTGHPGNFVQIKGPRWTKYVTIHNHDMGDGSYEWTSPTYLDTNGNLWGGGYNAYGYQSLGYWSGSSNSSGWNSNEAPAENYPDFEMLNYENKRRVIIPAGTRIMNMAPFGWANRPLQGWIDDRGKLLWSGDDGDTHRTEYHYSFWEYARNDQGQESQHLMHSGPSD